MKKEMGKVFIHGEMVTHMMDSGKMKIRMAKVPILLKMVQFTQVNLKMEKEMG